jgi:hypothetical protein
MTTLHYKWLLNCCWPSPTLSNSALESGYSMTGGLTPINLFRCHAHWGSRPEIFFPTEPLRDSAVGRATGRRRGRSTSPGRVKNFLFSTSSRPALRSTKLPIQWVPGAVFPGLKRPGREADHSPPASAKVKKMWIYIHSTIRLHGVVLN